jgi:hypothetical protein
MKLALIAIIIISSGVIHNVMSGLGFDLEMFRNTITAEFGSTPYAEE